MFDYINEQYGLNLVKNSSVQHKDGRKGQVTKARGQYIYIQWDGDKEPTGPYHPTSNLTHLDK